MPSIHLPPLMCSQPPSLETCAMSTASTHSHTHTHTLLSEQPKDLGSGCLLLGGVSTLTT